MSIDKWKQWLEVATNVAILMVCLLVAVIGVKKFLLSDSGGDTGGAAKGAQISIAGVDWSRADRTLVLVLNTHCHFCRDSAEFYKKLLPEASAQKMQIVAVLPQPPQESRQYLASLGISMSSVGVQQAPMEDAQASGTPTLILANNNGQVVRAWVGKLPARGEADVWKAIH